MNILTIIRSIIFGFLLMFTFGDRVVKLRRQMQLTQSDLVQRVNELEGELPDNLSCHITLSRLGRIERNVVEPVYSEICALAIVLKTSVQCLTLNECTPVRDDFADTINRLSESMSKRRKQEFLRFVAMTADFAQNMDCR